MFAYLGLDVCDVFPAWDPPEGISFSNEFLWTLGFVLFLNILYLSYNFIWKGNPLMGDLKQEAYRKAVLWVPEFDVRYLSNTASFVSCVFRRVKDHHTLPDYSSLLKKTCLRQVTFDKWFPLVHSSIIIISSSRSSSITNVSDQHDNYYCT